MVLGNIRKLCEAQGITLAALERATGISNGLIAKWSVNVPRVDLLKRVADYFGCTVDDLLREK